MTDQELRDHNGKLIGKIKTLNSGKQEIRDRNGRLCGTYDPKLNETRDQTGRLVGKGNFLATLI